MDVALTKVGGPQVSSANPQICGLTFLGLRSFRKCGHFWTIFFGDLRMFDMQIQLFFADLKLPQIRKNVILSPYKYKLEMLSFKLKDDWDCLRHGIS
jgi:hypothetical protein